MIQEPKSEFYREYNLVNAHKHPSERMPRAHQIEAFGALREWFESKPSPHAGGILVLPTGGGKTFTAVRFLCKYPLSEGYKVLWLAHTHHLLEQAFYSFGPVSEESVEVHEAGYEVGWITGERTQLNMRVVSGTPGHLPIQTTKPSDDVLICTLQTATRAYKKLRPEFVSFLESADGKLVLVFDEAHHSPASSYRRLITDLLARYPKMCLLGLTATPTYEDEKKRGWLKRLFPQEIIYEVGPDKLMADRILARPKVEPHRTEITPEFDESDYQRWLSTYRDIPEEIVTKLAENRERNLLIANTYVENRERYGKAIIFADRWFQCDMLRELLRERDVRADVIYSHVDADPGSVEARRRRHKNENAQVLDAFRKNKLDVLINVRMLTEGTDVPDVQTVFLTRQTTSRILLTQMVGRALRGPEFGGTEYAYIVSFIDDWEHLINWAEYGKLVPGQVDDTVSEYGERPPLTLISIDLVRRLARQMDSGENVSSIPFLQLMPIGWYRVEFMTAVEASDDLEQVRQLLMVFDNEKESYERFIEYLKGNSIKEFADEEIRFDEQQERLVDWLGRFFSDVEVHLGENLLSNLFHIARHVAQNDGEPPVFFRFEERDAHNLDALAQQIIDEDLGRRAEDQRLQAEYERKDRYWKAIYANYERFRFQYEGCVNRILRDLRSEAVLPGKVISTPEPIPDREPSEETKKQVRERDGYRCLCCASTWQLQVDHIKPFSYGGEHAPSNLQTLCKICNGMKSDKAVISFRVHKSPLSKPPLSLDLRMLRAPVDIHNAEEWKRAVRRGANFFYQCAAVESVDIQERAGSQQHWEIWLYPDINPHWIEPYLPQVVGKVQHVQKEAGCYERLSRVTVKSPNQPQVSYQVEIKPPTFDASLIFITRIRQRSFIKRVPTSHITDVTVRHQGTLESLLVASSSNILLLFTNQGKVYARKVQDISTSNLVDQGVPFESFFNSSEKVTAAVAVPGFAYHENLIMLTRKGRVKRFRLHKLASVRSDGMRVLTLDKGDELGWVKSIRSDQELIVVSRDGQAIRFRANDVRIMGPTAAGVGAMRLQGYDRIAGLDVINPDASFLLIVTEHGFANLIPLYEYSTQNRNGTGKSTFSKRMQRTGKIVAAHAVSDRDDIILLSKEGVLLRKPVREIPKKSRTSQGTRVVELKRNDTIIAVTVVF